MRPGACVLAWQGLNLTAANHCLLCDPWWNPATEDQAIDRIHRMGQLRPVHVRTTTITTTTSAD